MKGGKKQRVAKKFELNAWVLEVASTQELSVSKVKLAVLRLSEAGKDQEFIHDSG